MSPTSREPDGIRIAPQRVLENGTLLEECLKCVFLNQGAGGVVTTDAAGRLRFLNPMARQMLGIGPDPDLNITVDSFLVPGSLDLRVLMRRLHREDAVRAVHTRIQRSDGTEREVELTVVLLRDSHGRRTGFLVTGTDRSHEVWLQQELELREHRLSQIVASTADAVVGIDAAGRIQSWNRGAENTYGYSAEDVLGRPAVTVLLAGLPEGRGADGPRGELLARLKEDTAVQSWETAHRHKSGRELRVLVTLSPLQDQEGRRTGTSALIKDITELKRLEEELNQSERLAAVGQLSASIAHEVKNPLAAIRGAVEILGESLPSREGEESEVVSEVLEQIDRLDRLVEDLLSFARPNPPRKKPVQVGELLERTLQMLRGEPLRKGVAIYRNFDPDLPLLWADDTQLEQAFMNVILNALQAMDGSGTLTVTTWQAQGGIHVSFRDTGPGLSPESLKRMAEPFYTTKHRGTGLGLSIVQKVLESHRGRMRAENHPEGGVLFTVVLPLPSEEERQALLRAQGGNSTALPSGGGAS